jgi:hypothetical protein
MIVITAKAKTVIAHITNKISGPSAATPGKYGSQNIPH